MNSWCRAQDFCEILEEDKGILESRIKPDGNSTNPIYRFVDTILPPLPLVALQKKETLHLISLGHVFTSESVGFH
jgi:hypothetical protein